MYTKERIEELVERIKDAGLYAPSSFWKASVETLQNTCNGIGADWMPKKVRKTITKACSYAECAALIHDWQYANNNGTKKAQESADELFRNNALDEVCYKYPQWWNPRRWFAERAVLGMYAVLVESGYQAYCIAFTEKTVKNRKKKS